MKTALSKFALTTIAMALSVALSVARAHGHGHGHDNAEEVLQLSDTDIELCIEKAKKEFIKQYGHWFLNRSPGIDTELNEEQDELKISIRYIWGVEKAARYTCQYEYAGRIEVDRAFSGP